MLINKVFIFNRLCALWPKGYLRGSLGKSRQNALVAFKPHSTQAIKYKKLWPANVRKTSQQKFFIPYYFKLKNDNNNNFMDAADLYPFSNI